MGQKDNYSEEYKACRKIILGELKKMSLPKGHPFLGYPDTVESRSLECLILLSMILGKESRIPIELLHKCNAVESGVFSHSKYLEGMDEALILYYILITNMENVSSVIYEPNNIMQNGKTVEYSCLFSRPIECLVNIEVKTMRCDPFIREQDANLVCAADGTALIKKLINDDEEYENILKKYPEVIELKKSTYYSAFNRNIKRIVEKFEGKKNIQCPMINIGFVCIHFSTSIEEFYTYMFHKEKGIYKSMNWGSMDALVLFVLDAKNDLLFQNIYEMGYVVTMLKNDTPFNRAFMKMMRLDNFVLMGDKVDKDIYDNAQCCAKLYKVLKREGFLNIVPYNATEEEIYDYINYLQNETIRYE